MKAKVRPITGASGSARPTDRAMASARTIDAMTDGTAEIIRMTDGAESVVIGTVQSVAEIYGTGLTARATADRPIDAGGSRSKEAGLIHFLAVAPEASQEVVWLDPYGIEYTVTTSTNLKWYII